MKGQQLLVGFLLVCAMTLRGAAPFSSTNAEPRYQNKSLSQWVLLSEPQGEIFAPKDWQAADAVRQIGTNAIPWLLQWICSEHPETGRLGVQGISLLGTNSHIMIPELTRLVNDWRSSAAWSNAIPALEGLGSEGFPHLLAAATNLAAPSALRWRAVHSIRRLGSHMNGLGFLAALGTNAPLAVPVLVRCLQDEDWRVAAEAAGALGNYTIEPGLAVPALAAALESRTNPPPPAAAPDEDPFRWRGDISVRWAAAHALRDFAEVIHLGGFPQNITLQPPAVPEYRDAMRAAVPMLAKGLGDDDSRVACWAALALGEAALEPILVVPALIKGLGHTNVWMRRAAAQALGNFGEAARPALPALTRLQHSDPLVEMDARNAVQKIAPDPK